MLKPLTDVADADNLADGLGIGKERANELTRINYEIFCSMGENFSVVDYFNKVRESCDSDEEYTLCVIGSVANIMGRDSQLWKTSKHA